MRNTLNLLLICFIVISCDSQHEEQNDNKQYDSVAIQLNNRAMELSLLTNRDSTELAITLLSQAIQLDSNYYLAYNNMVTLLLMQSKRDSALSVLEIMIDREPNFAEGLSVQGHIYNKQGKHEMAKQKYQLAMKAYDSRIKKNEGDVNAKVNRTFLMLFLYDKETALREIDKILDEHPEDSFALTMKNDIIPSFEQNEFINSY